MSAIRMNILEEIEHGLADIENYGAGSKSNCYWNPTRDAMKQYLEIARAGIRLHDYLWTNVPDLIDLCTGSQLAADGLESRLQALKEAIGK